MKTEEPDSTPLGFAEMVSLIGDEKIRFQRLGDGQFRAAVTTKNTKVTFDTSREIGLELGANQTIGIVVWLKQDDVNAMLNARKKGAETHGENKIKDLERRLAEREVTITRYNQITNSLNENASGLKEDIENLRRRLADAHVLGRLLLDALLAQEEAERATEAYDEYALASGCIPSPALFRLMEDKDTKCATALSLRTAALAATKD